jgi:hypothetical protein
LADDPTAEITRTRREKVSPDDVRDFTMVVEDGGSPETK